MESNVLLAKVLYLLTPLYLFCQHFVIKNGLLFMKGSWISWSIKLPWISWTALSITGITTISITFSNVCLREKWDIKDCLKIKILLQLFNKKYKRLKTYQSHLGIYFKANWPINFSKKLFALYLNNYFFSLNTHILLKKMTSDLQHSVSAWSLKFKSSSSNFSSD